MPAKQKWIFILQLSVTLGLLALIFHDAQFRTQIGEVLRGANPAWLFLGIVLAGIENGFGVIRWRIFLRLLDIPIPFLRTAQLYLVGLFFNLFLVGAAGGDAVKVLILINQGYRRSRVILSVILDRLSGLAVMVIVSGYFIWLHSDWLMEAPSVARLVKVVLVYLVVSLALMVLSFWVACTGWANRLPDNFPLRARLQEFCEGYALFVSKWRQALLASAISLAMLFAYFGVYFCSTRAFGVEATLSQVFAFMPAIDVITGLPISIGGVGVREHLFKIVLGALYETPEAQAVMISLAGYFCAASWGLVGALLLPFFWSVFKKARLEAMEKRAETAPAWQRAVQSFRPWPRLYHYGRNKMRIDPAYSAVRDALKGSSLPLHDLGCGAGFLAAYLRESGEHFAIYGSDLSAPKIKIAREILEPRYAALSFQVADAVKPPAGLLGNVVALDLLHYFEDAGQREAIRAWVQLLAPEGQLLIRTTLKEVSWRYWATLLEEGWVRATGWIRGGHWNFPRRALIEETLRECGFTVQISPLWGWTPFNSYWIIAQKRTKNASPVSLETT